MTPRRLGTWLGLLALLGAAQCGSCHGRGSKGGATGGARGAAATALGGGGPAAAPGKAGSAFTARATAAEIKGYPVPQAVSRVALAKGLPHLDPGTTLASQAAAPVANTSVSVVLLGASRHQILPGAAAPAGQAYVVLDTRWTNVHPKARVRKAALEHERDITMGVGALGSGSTAEQSATVLADVAYEVPHFVDHAYLLADGVAYPMARAGASLVHAAPRAKAFVLARKGDTAELRFAFLVPAKAADLAFRFFDYSNGAVAFPVAGDPAKAVGDGNPPAGAIAKAQAKRIDLAVTSVAKAASYAGTFAPKGWHFVRVGLAGKSLSASGQVRDIVQIDPRQYLWVVTDHGTLRYGSGGTVNGHGVLRFTPEVWERQTAVFLVPDGEKVVTVAVRDGGTVTRLALGGGTVPPLPAGAATGRDGTTLEVRVVSLWRGETEAVVSYAVKNLVAAKGIALDPLQFPITAGDGTVLPDSFATAGLVHRPPSPFVVPPGGSLRFSFAYETQKAPGELKMRGANREVDVGLAKVPAPKAAPTRGARTHIGDDLVTPDLDPALAEETPDAVPPGEVVTGPKGPATAAADVSAGSLEPDDDRAHAHSLAVGQTMRGTLDRPDDVDEDFYRVDVDTPGLYRVDVIGDQVDQVAYKQPSRDDIVRDAHHGHAVIRDLYLRPGPQYLDVSGNSGGRGTYTVKVTPQGPASRWGEHEPNDGKEDAEPLVLGQPRTGRIPNRSDTDVYRLSIQVHAHVRIVLRSPQGQQGYFYLARAESTTVEAQHPGGDSVWDGWLWPGEYFVSVKAEQPSLRYYRIEAQVADPFQVAGDLEPDDDVAHARPMPRSLSVVGTSLADSDDDVFRLPILAKPTVATVSIVPKDLEAEIEPAKGDSFDPIKQTDTGIQRYRVPASRQLYLHVGAGGVPYRVSIRFADGPAPRPSLPLPVRLTMPQHLPAVAAWLAARQRVQIPITLTPTAPVSGPVRLSGWTSHPSWHLVLPPPVDLSTGKPVTVEATLDVDPEAWADRPVTLVVAATDAGGDRRLASTRMSAQCGADPVNPGGPWTVPKALRGGLDVAWTALGAVPVASSADARAAQRWLFDGEADLDHVYSVRSDALPSAVTVRLAGDGPVPVAGLLLTGVRHQVEAESVRRFDLLLSTDGTDFTKVLSGTLRPNGLEQAFVLTHPVEAHFARLVMRTPTPLGRDDVGLSEIKVVAVPGRAGARLDAFDIADPPKGGHVAWMTSEEPNGKDIEEPLTAAKEKPVLRLDPVHPNRFTVGFLNGRSAQITRLRWVDPKRESGTPQMSWVSVAVSDTGPAGPWKPLGKWTLDRDANGVATWKLDHPIWVRFLRFTVPPPKGDQEEVALPDTLQVFERPQGDGYLSILGEWGLYGRAAIHEALAKPVPPPASAPAHATRKTALALVAGTAHGDTVERGVDLDWYTISVPKTDNTLSLDLASDDPSRLSVHVEDASGRSVPVKPLVDQGHLEAEAKVKGGQTFRVRVEEPERNVVFTWDTSGSVIDYVPLIDSAVATYTSEVKRGRERVGLRLFEGNELVPHLSDDARQLEAALAGGRWDDPGSSGGETSLENASLDLEGAHGSRAVMIITDADSTSQDATSALWPVLEQVRPRVFSEQIQVGGFPRYQQSIMQDWAGVNGGYYTSFGTQTALDLGFSQASCMLRRPVGYRITAKASYRAPPPPGTISVTGPAARRTSFELILDASGSMMSRLGNSTRIGVARHVLEHLVTRQLPKGTPVALRVYGQRVPRACRTDLVVPLSPLNPARMVRRIAHVVPQDRSGTPIAASLLKVGSDLKHAHGTKIVLLVTDGGESCHGDPAKAIRTLKAKGVDVRLNIVGFTIKDKTVQRAYKSWASLSGGRFFHASNEKDLARAVAASLRTRYQVVDEGGDVVGQGSVGGKPVTVKPGSYSVRVLTSPVQTVSTVKVTSGSTTAVKLEAPR